MYGNLGPNPTVICGRLVVSKDWLYCTGEMLDFFVNTHDPMICIVYSGTQNLATLTLTFQGHSRSNVMAQLDS